MIGLSIQLMSIRELTIKVAFETIDKDKLKFICQEQLSGDCLYD